MATFLFRNAKAMAAAILAGWKPIRWEWEDRFPVRKLASCRMAAPSDCNSKRARKNAFHIVGLCVVARYGSICGAGCCYGWVAHRSLPMKQQEAEAFTLIEALIGERPKR